MLDAVLNSLLIGTGLLYKALWPILFGVLLTALIETLVDRDRMARLLGGRGWRAIGTATAAGAASSACTYGALSITQSLFKKGASAEASFAFSFASTNLVFELGIVIYALLGWQFLLAELLGGFVLIAIMYLLVRLTLPRRLFEQARERLQAQSPQDSGPERFTRTLIAREGWKYQLSTRAGWARIGRNYFHTLGVIWKSVLFGFLIAGFIIEWVPARVWHALFLPAGSFAGVAENAALGVLAGVVSFIGSIGNVPFAAALWAGGASFAGVIGCIYADLITVPVLNLWKNFFGWRATAYVFAVFFTTMAASAVLMEYLFAALDWVPPPINRAGFTDFLRWHFDTAFVLTLLMLAASAALYGLIRIQAQTQTPRPQPADHRPE